jgi:nucleotide-binding universal stress UspA family protein
MSGKLDQERGRGPGREGSEWGRWFASRELWRRLWSRAGGLDDLMALVEREGAAEAERLAAAGVTLARAAGWDARGLVHRSHSGEGFAFARLAEQQRPDVVVLGARGLSGVRAVLGSVSDMVVHYSPVPVLVVPEPLLGDERSAAATGPVVVGHDGSSGARTALAGAAWLFAARDQGVATVGADAVDDGELIRAGAAAARTVALDPGGVAASARAVADALAGCAFAQGAAVIGVGSRGRSAGRKILLGNVAMAVLHRAHRPVLVVPDAPRFGR